MTIDTITLGGGCFWCLEAVYQEAPGILSIESGYMGGRVERPTYKQVCAGTTGHIEVVRISFDQKPYRKAVMQTFGAECARTGSPYGRLRIS